MACPDDNTIASFLDGRLSAKEAKAFRKHAETCRRCQTLLETFTDVARQGDEAGTEATRWRVGARADARSSDLFVRGTSLGRYVVLDLVGKGGMGIVYAAYDPELNRKIALKVVGSRPAAGGEGEAKKMGHTRLLREAQALARLSHPNVVTVHDVQTVGGDVVIAMEFVEGRTLATWLVEEKRPWQKIRAVFLQAGRGLAAAHATGLVHRDFKPQNVLVAKGGRVLVTDFGLVRRVVDEPSADEASGAPAPASQADEDLASSSLLPSVLDLSITRTGSVLGTPGYMAPEQYQGAVADAQADQFAFCVALYEALYGEHPFGSPKKQGFVAKVLAGKVVEPRPGAKVASWIRPVLLRGLRPDPADRYPSMDMLLHRLEQDPVARRKRLVTWAGLFAAMAALGGIAIASLVRSASSPPLCRGAERRLEGVWDQAIKRAIEVSFAATGRPYARDTFQRVERLLDRHAASWVAMRTDTCEASHVRHEQSDKLFDLRMGCLDRRLSELGALTSLFAYKADGAIVDTAVQAASKMRGLERCADAAALQAAYPPPENPAMRDKVEILEKRLDDADAREKAGKYREGLEIVSAVADDAAGLTHPPLQAEERFLRGVFLYRIGDMKGAETALYEAARAAAEAKDDDRLAQVWIELVLVVGDQARHDEAISLRKVAEIAIARAGGEELMRARLSNSLGTVLRWAGKYGEARQHFEPALAITQRLLGPSHPDVAKTLNNLGVVFGEQGKHDEARQHFERALAIRQEALGLDHPSVATTLNNLGNVGKEQGRYAQARQHYERALAISERALGASHPDLARTLSNLGVIFTEQEEYDEARRHFERAQAIWEEALGPDHPNVAYALQHISELLHRQGRHREAYRYLERSLAIQEKVFAPDHPRLAHALTTLGKIWLGQKRPAAALTPLERALALREAAGVSRIFLAETQFALARALWDAEGDRKRAAALAKHTRDIYASLGEGRKKDLAEVDRWLATRPP